jgi:hypothetical protein
VKLTAIFFIAILAGCSSSTSTQNSQSSSLGTWYSYNAYGTGSIGIYAILTLTATTATYDDNNPAGATTYGATTYIINDTGFILVFPYIGGFQLSSIQKKDTLVNCGGGSEVDGTFWR